MAKKSDSKRHAWDKQSKGSKCKRCGLKMLIRSRPAKRKGYGRVYEIVFRFPDGQESTFNSKTPPCPGTKGA